ncbi:MAG TPA: RNase J family beta-CASP ribonuclease [Candidatus Nanoarchaeia archaeon]|nr:RNase J family beta-CASP ribonuclease [Candidatus Nanoarchaeia archaeon]
MAVEIITVGGYDVVGRNCTAIKIDDDVIVFDIGIHLESYIQLTEDEDIKKFEVEDLIKVKAIPDLSVIEHWKDKIRAIIPSHAHLDHVGAIPFLAGRYKAPIICTPFTAAVLRAIIRDEKIPFKNRIKTVNTGSSIKITKDITAEFITVTHSTPQTAMVALHTKHGIIVYANDFKFDMSPTLGKTPDLKRLRQLGQKGVYALVVESTYADDDRKMPSESVAKEMLRDAILDDEKEVQAILVTTFSSHIARLKSIIELGKKLGRKVIFLGRSLAKYVNAAEEVGIVHFSKEIEIVKYGNNIRKRLNELQPRKKKYLIVVTGHQGEPKATLAKIARDVFKFRLDHRDKVIFSCNVIPTPTNEKNREHLERDLKHRRIRIFKGIHVSGHAARQDLQDLLEMLKPEHIIPSHGEEKMRKSLAGLCKEMGWKKNIHLLAEGQHAVLK